MREEKKLGFPYGNEPWTGTEYYQEGPRVVFEIGNGTGYTVATVPIHVGSSREPATRKIAALLLAAPDLLEACEGLRKLLWAEGYADQTPEMARADAAIAKAVGA